jgi:hypothetical protein
MKLDEYLLAVNESKREFAARSGVPYRSVYRTCVEGWCGTRNAVLVVRATHARPTPSGGVVTFDDLARPKASAA